MFSNEKNKDNATVIAASAASYYIYKHYTIYIKHQQ